MTPWGREQILARRVRDLLGKQGTSLQKGKAVSSNEKNATDEERKAPAIGKRGKVIAARHQGEKGGRRQL